VSGDGSTPGPWAATKGKPRKVTSQGVLICTAVLRNYATTAQNKHGKGIEEAAANARRIVAAVNATADIPVEALEAGVVAKLVEALEWLEGYLRDTPHHNAPAAANARSALALAKGGAA